MHPQENFLILDPLKSLLVSIVLLCCVAFAFKLTMHKKVAN